MKKFLRVLAACFSLFFTKIEAQQNHEFQVVQKYFDSQKNMIFSAFQSEVNQSTNLDRKELYRQLEQLISKVDSLENEAYILALVKVKINEDLSLVLSDLHQDGGIGLEKDPQGKLTLPLYPGGMDKFRQELIDLFYYSGKLGSDSELQTQLSFVVNNKGVITKVNAKGDNPFFNRQALIATYRMRQFFLPAQFNQVPVAYEYQIPIRFTRK